jgi:hypothetical protein
MNPGAPAFNTIPSPCLEARDIQVDKRVLDGARDEEADARQTPQVHVLVLVLVLEAARRDVQQRVSSPLS